MMWLVAGTPEHGHRCVHPHSRRANGLPVVIHASKVHDSTGSTVDTFLSQADIENPEKVVFTPRLSGITEETPGDLE